MSKASKTRKKEERAKQKKARKEAMKRMYADWRDKGRNTKSKRSVKNSKGIRLVKNHKHAITRCGNPACQRCNDVFFKPFLDKDGNPKGMPQWMYQKWRELNV